MSGKEKPREREERKEDHSLGGGSMMDNISRMIPAPPGANDVDEDSGGEEDGTW